MPGRLKGRLQGRPWTFGKAVLGGLLVVWVAVRIALNVWPPTRDAWALVTVGVDTEVLYARWSVASTGFYARQLTTHFWLLRQEGDVVEARGMFGPSTLDEDGVTNGVDRLARDPKGGWSARMSGTAAQLSGRVQGATTACPPEVGTFQGVVGTTPENNAGGVDGGNLVTGPSVLVYTHAVGVVEGAALYVLGNGASLAIDPLSSCPTWARIGSESWSGPALPFAGTSAGQAHLGKWTVTWRPTAARTESRLYDHVLAPERWLAAIVGWPSPTLRLQRVGVRIEGPGFDEPRTGVLLVRGVAL